MYEVELPDAVTFKNPDEECFRRGAVLGYIKNNDDGVFSEDCYLTSRGLVPTSWVTRIYPHDDEDEDDEDEVDYNKCRICGEPNDGGDGWDYMCGNCADREYIKEHPEEFED